MSAPQWSFSISAVPKVSSRIQLGRTSSKNHRCLDKGVNLIRQRVLPISSWRAGPSTLRDTCHPRLACSVLECPVYNTGGKGLLHDSKYQEPYEKSLPQTDQYHFVQHQTIINLGLIWKKHLTWSRKHASPTPNQLLCVSLCFIIMNL